MELKEVIEKRQTIREFKDIDIPIEIINYAIENGFKAPSYNHLKEWDFIILKTTEDKAKLINAENLGTKRDIQKDSQVVFNDVTIKAMYEYAIPKQKSMILDAPLILMVVYKPKTPIKNIKRIYDLNCLASVWTCIENVLLSLAEHDVYGVTYIPKKTDDIKLLFNIPNDLEVASIIPIGYKQDDAIIPKKKSISISEHIHYNNW
ncbi:MAG: hypothetical protein A2W99_03480 [Bacteroidetes bacterium GWF2_33_16]|nr:MAG: hypothetical protein A2X00_11590 [Bacteroidetes bacterium GWE2_32_14]OFY08247.1 MAG: hypothetical protein A2W99_03480 [Bacteroidetes bacterium GWF2_33_16]